MSIRCFKLNLAMFLSIAVLAGAQSKQDSVTITEPATFSLSRLFSYADKVAVVKIVSGTTEAYDVTIYKGEVVEAFKGVTLGEVIYFGPYIRTEIGGEYILFLRDRAELMQPKNKAVGYGAVRYSEVFDEGYSLMLTSYECVFEETSQSHPCDYAVRVCTDYIRLPKSLSPAPPEDTSTPFGCRWVKRHQFTAELGRMAKKP